MKAGIMHTIDTLAFVLFVLWLFGFIHIILAMTIIAVLYGIISRKKIYDAIGSAYTTTIRKRRTPPPIQFPNTTEERQKEIVEK